MSQTILDNVANNVAKILAKSQEIMDNVAKDLGQCRKSFQ